MRMQRVVPLILCAAGLMVGSGCSPPSMGPSKETFKTVDALYTAVGARSPKLLDQCDTRLTELKEQGQVPEPAFLALQAIIVRARNGQWETASKELYSFMRGQKSLARH